MGTYIYRFVTIFILFGFIFAGNEVYADGGYLDVPEIDDQFNQFDQNSISENDKKQALSKTKEEDGFWDWLTKPVSDAGNWVVDKISSAWNW
ncbi:MAG: hypothetical protein WB502_10310, partial [Thermoactinomyces sp.]